MYEIGQKVVCVQTSRNGVVKEGGVYQIQSFQICEGCGGLGINVGTKPLVRLTKCNTCSFIWENNGVAYFDASIFRPLDDLYNTEIEELMNEVNERVPFEL